MKELLEYLARQLVDEPDGVEVEQFDEDDGTVVLELEEVDGGTRLHVVETSPEWSTALELHALAWVTVA
jgi:hypothetical protein